MGEKLQDIENSAAQFAGIAAQELAGKALTSEQADIVRSIPHHIAAWETFVDPTLHGDDILIPASASAMGGAVRPATGHPQAIYVIVPDPEYPGELTLTRGAVYSYYETELKADEWIHAATTSGGSEGRPYVVPAEDIHPVHAKLNTITAAVRAKEHKSAESRVQVELEANVVRRSSGAVWYTIYAPGFDGADVITTVVDASGRQVFQSFPLPVENGQRYDMVPTEDLRSGHYFIRVNDVTGRTLASARFLLVQ